jgi:hypothetical protein
MGLMVNYEKIVARVAKPVVQQKPPEKEEGRKENPNLELHKNGFVSGEGELSWETVCKKIISQDHPRT